MSAMVIMPWTARRRRLIPGRLNPAQRAAQLFNFTLVRRFLALRNFDEFQNFIELVNHAFQRFGNFRGVGHRLADRGRFGGTEIGRLAPRL